MPRRICTKPTWGYREARDTLNQVRRGRGSRSVIAIPAPDGRSATFVVRSVMTHFVEAKEKTAKARPHKGKGSKGGTSSKSSQGSKGKSDGKSTSKGEGDPLKQRLVSNPLSIVW